MSIRRSAFVVVGGFDNTFTTPPRYGYEDCDIACRLLHHHFTVRRSRNVVCQHLKRIGAREYVGRGRSSANAEMHLLKKHPQLEGERRIGPASGSAAGCAFSPGCPCFPASSSQPQPPSPKWVTGRR